MHENHWLNNELINSAPDSIIYIPTKFAFKNLVYSLVWPKGIDLHLLIKKKFMALKMSRNSESGKED